MCACPSFGTPRLRSRDKPRWFPGAYPRVTHNGPLTGLAANGMSMWGKGAAVREKPGKAKRVRKKKREKWDMQGRVARGPPFRRTSFHINPNTSPYTP